MTTLQSRADSTPPEILKTLTEEEPGRLLITSDEETQGQGVAAEPLLEVGELETTLLGKMDLVPEEDVVLPETTNALSAKRTATWRETAPTLATEEVAEEAVLATNVTRKVIWLEIAPTPETEEAAEVVALATNAMKKVTWPETAQTMLVVAAVAVAEPATTATRKVTWLESALNPEKRDRGTISTMPLVVISDRGGTMEATEALADSEVRSERTTTSLAGSEMTIPRWAATTTKLVPAAGVTTTQLLKITTKEPGVASKTPTVLTRTRPREGGDTTRE